MVSREHLGFESEVPFGLFSSLVPYLTVMRSVVPNGRDVILCRNGIFQSTGAEIVCVAKTSHSESLSINIKISPQSSSSDPGHLRVYMHSSAVIKVKMLWESKHFSVFWHDGEKQSQLFIPPPRMDLYFCLRVPAVSKLLIQKFQTHCASTDS